VHNEETGTQTERVGIGPCYSLVVKSDGAVAWIADDEWVPSKEYQVHVVDRLGSRVVSSGTEIEGKSLRLVGSTLSWIQGGRRQTAVLH
jgi:hypothetical protein